MYPVNGPANTRLPFLGARVDVLSLMTAGISSWARVGVMGYRSAKQRPLPCCDWSREHPDPTRDTSYVSPDNSSPQDWPSERH